MRSKRPSDFYDITTVKASKSLVRSLEVHLYHALRHSFISILEAQGKTWDQVAEFVGHLDRRTT